MNSVQEEWIFAHIFHDDHEIFAESVAAITQEEIYGRVWCVGENCDFRKNVGKDKKKINLVPQLSFVCLIAWWRFCSFVFVLESSSR